MPSFASRLKELRESKGLSQKTLSECLKISKSSVNMYEHGEREPSFELLEAIADFFNCDMNYLLGKSDIVNATQYRGLLAQQDFPYDNIFPISTIKLPLLGNVACGEPIFADEQLELYVDVGTNINADFCLRAQGDSMIGARIYDGDIVFVRKQDMVDDGEIAVVLIEDEATLKRVHYDREANVLSLYAENPKYKTMRFYGEQLNQIRILGKAVAFQSDVR